MLAALIDATWVIIGLQVVLLAGALGALIVLARSMFRGGRPHDGDQSPPSP